MVRERGVAVCNEFLEKYSKSFYANCISAVDPKLIDFIKGYPDDDAWIIVKSLFICSDLFPNVIRDTAIDDMDWIDWPYSKWRYPVKWK